MYCAPVNGDGWGDIVALVNSGLMRAGHKITGGNDQYFHCTAAGVSVAMALRERKDNEARS